MSKPSGGELHCSIDKGGKEQHNVMGTTDELPQETRENVKIKGIYSSRNSTEKNTMRERKDTAHTATGDVHFLDASSSVFCIFWVPSLTPLNCPE